MAVKINFDSENNVIMPSFVLTTRNGSKIGSLPAYKVVFRNGMSDVSEISFLTNKADCGLYFKNGVEKKIWDEIKNFKLLWIKEWNRLFETSVELEDSDGIIKRVSAKSLGECELSQLRIYDLEINTEEDISRDDYEKSILYNPDNPKASILHRILNKAPHYTIKHVDTSIAGIQRFFSFNDKSIVDALSEVAEEINFYISYECSIRSDGTIAREISFYDIEDYCLDCKHRGNHLTGCTDCGSQNIKRGYGNDTTIFIDRDNLAENILFSTDTNSVKNVYRLEAGDELMTSTIASCNPNGSREISFFSDEDKKDMSEELAEKLNEYDTQYTFYNDEYIVPLDNEAVDRYNDLVEKYKYEDALFSDIKKPVKGYVSLIEIIYNAIDFEMYLRHEMMPDKAYVSTSAADQIQKLRAFSYTPVAVQSLSTCSVTAATNSVIAMATVLVDPGYEITAQDAAYLDGVWSGKLVISNYANEEDVAISDVFEVEINDNYKEFLKQKIKKSLNRTSGDISGIVDIFDLHLNAFKREIKKYCLTSLSSFHNACEACLNILIEQGVADDDEENPASAGLHKDMYLPYFEKLSAISNEISIRESEIGLISGIYNSKGEVTVRGIRIAVDDERRKIQEILNMQSFLGMNLWLELIAYRREDTYKNSNYISDGLTNSEIMRNAEEFIKVAKKEIYKSSMMQHSIKASLKNLLAMSEFTPIVDSFELGNWLRVSVDGILYKLRLVNYEISFDDLDILEIEFSDVLAVNDSFGDINKAIDSMKSITSSYDSTKRQAGQSKEARERMESWVDDGLVMTQMKIIDKADNQNIEWNEHGMLFREYVPELGDYDPHQMKIINKGLYTTNDNWLTSKAGVGTFIYYDPKTGEQKIGYGIIADKLVGNLVLSKEVGVFNSDNSIILDNNGFVLTTFTDDNGESKNVFIIQRMDYDESGNESPVKMLYLDDKGKLVINGSIGVSTGSDVKGLIDITDDIKSNIISVDSTLRDTISSTESSISEKYDANITSIQQTLNGYIEDTKKYMTFDDNGLTLGAEESPFKTVITNDGMYFKEASTNISYVKNNQLYIPNAAIGSTLLLGDHFFFAPREDGSFSLTWMA